RMVDMVQAASKAEERELLARYGNFEAAFEVKQMEEFVREHPELADDMRRAIYFHIDDHRWDWLIAMQTRREGGAGDLAALGPQSGEEILDVACYAGTFVYLCAERGCRVVGVDLDVSMARRLLQPYELLRYELVECNATTLAFPGHSFDKVLCADLL